MLLPKFKHPIREDLELKQKPIKKGVFRKKEKVTTKKKKHFLKNFRVYSTKKQIYWIHNER